MTTKSHRILLVCEPWFGSTGWAAMASLRRGGHEVEVVNYRQIIPKVTTARLKVVRRLLMPWFVRDYNRHLLRQADDFQPEILFVIKGACVLAETLRRFRARGVRTYNYYPDVSFFTHDKYIPKAMPEYDHVFTTKSFHLRGLKERLGIDSATFVPHGYMPEVHKPLALTEWDRKRYEVDVSFIGMHSPKKERLLASVRRALPDVGIRIWGNLWRERCSAPELAPCVAGQWITGWAYAKAIRAAGINLGINSEAVPGASSGDLMSRRSFEIPACGGFMIHERNQEVRTFYREGREMAAFDGPEELVEKVRHYLKRPGERRAIASAGFQRCVPAYSYDARMRECLEFHERSERGPSLMLHDAPATCAALRPTGTD